MFCKVLQTCVQICEVLQRRKPSEKYCKIVKCCRVVQSCVKVVQSCVEFCKVFVKFLKSVLYKKVLSSFCKVFLSFVQLCRVCKKKSCRMFQSCLVVYGFVNFVELFFCEFFIVCKKFAKKLLYRVVKFCRVMYCCGL